MIVVTPPASYTGAGIQADLRAAGFPDAEVVAVVDGLRVCGVTEADRSTVEAVVAAHVPPAAADPDEELAAAIASATSLDQLKKALLGNLGHAARVAGKPKDA